ncbi:hypothetical protein K227x_41730 [Rubripirellula lacrimiformis]|uniref:Uncharacterized protein n=1 Tax=Rubripirellula lacrimiformis TaxID=1930273 RepID=A0A517NF61_9BACT|nr:hypothetical protein [Rubripirellula lacrimiformis]QDT05769.1 hypothetical protein K227x_41730 [Rubripirellula lacrimiformis]
MLASALWVGGCANWKENSSVDALTSASRNPPAGQRRIGESKKSIVLDVEFVNIKVDQTDPDQAASLWQWVDETPIDVHLRSRLIDNGLRVGVVSSDERFRQRLSAIASDHDALDNFLASAAVASDVSRGEKRIPMRIGKRYELNLRTPIEGQHVAMARIGDQTIGRTLNNAQYLMAVHPIQMTGQQQIMLKLRTEIQHGEMRQKWIGSDSAIRIDQRRETWSIPSLDLDIEAAQGDMIVIAPTWPLTGLAKRMLAGLNADNQEEQIVVLIRIDRVPTAIDQL